MTLQQPLSYSESRKTGEFIVSEGHGRISRDATNLEIGHALQDGTVLKYHSHTDGNELAPLALTDFDTGGALLSTVTIAGILLGPHDSSNDATGQNAEIAGVPYISRLAEVNGALLIYPSGISATEQAAVVAALAKSFIIVR
jgi:hypothetical protein